MKKTVTAVWYVNLAVADLLCCLTVPFLMAYRVLRYWPYGGAVCKILPTVTFLNMFASVFTLTLISLDRFSLILCPVWAQNHRSVSRAGLLCGLAWFLALLLGLPDLIYIKTVELNNQTFCTYATTQSVTRAFRVTRSVFGFFVPLLVITVCYMLVARRVRDGRFKSQKALRIMVGVVTAFFVCWMPFHSVGLVMEYGEKSDVGVAYVMYPLALTLAYVNSCLNPVLYVFMGQDFKERAMVSLRRVFENAFNEDAA